MMPKKDGITVLRTIRREKNQTPVLLLTARDSVEDRVTGLDAGANDYLIKPFAYEELLARIRVLLRKPEEAPKTCYRVGDLEVHMDTHQVLRGGKEISLSGKSLHFSGIWYRMRESYFPERGLRSICGISIIREAPM